MDAAYQASSFSVPVCSLQQPSGVGISSPLLINEGVKVSEGDVLMQVDE